MPSSEHSERLRVSRLDRPLGSLTDSRLR